ncbi:SAM-dependent methyltransferase [Bryobacter aggregatus]|uniref:SAM-dependent methyltransferase n=1 Tax=Bryobacter aggregatus TaxID=360054 RepID=UPI00068A61AE|nr:class I SAM-dependent methyltransferase [Bryobacter aggregatus]
MQALDQMVRYYEESGPDYAAWSPAFNMHFGYWKAGDNPFDREAMLEQMSDQVIQALEGATDVLDLGCGLGATARNFAASNPAAHITGITIVPWQLQRARQLSTAYHNLDFCGDDYTQTHFGDSHFDGAFAIESFCHGPGRDKASCIEEAHRVLKRGGRLVVADGFLKQTKPMNRFLTACHQRICDCWTMDSLPVLPDFLKRLRQTGFNRIEAKEISWNVAPSVAHVPAVTLRFLVTEFLVKRGRLSRERWNNILAPVLTGIVGLARAHFGYFLIGASKA